MKTAARIAPALAGALCVATPTLGQNGLIAVGSPAGEPPEVRFYEPMTGAVVDSFLAFDPGDQFGVRVALGDVTGDGVADLIAGAGPNGLSLVRVFDGATHAQIFEEFPYGSRFTGGVNVAAGDVNDDGFDDIIVGPGESHPAEVVIYDGASLLLLGSFLADDVGFERGLHVASGDIDGDGDDDIIVGRVFGLNASGPTNVAHSLMRAYDGPVAGYMGFGQAYTSGVQSGVFVTTGDFDNDGLDEVLVGPDGAIGSLTFTYNFSGNLFQDLALFSMSNPNFGGGVRVAAGDVNGDGHDDLVCAAGPWPSPNIGPLINIYSGDGLGLLSSFFGGAPSSANGIYVAGPWQLDCPADVNNDGLVTPADFNAWVVAFNSMAPGCDQNGDGMCTPADFNAWVINFNAGC